MDERTNLPPSDLVVALPEYQVGAEIGRGMFGVVWSARHRRLERDVAVKQFIGPLSTEGEHASRFEREARILAQLDHAHVVTVYDYREHGDLRLLVMEHLGGGTFRDRRATLSFEATIAATLAAAGALHHVHEHGILHRDVKPENLMFDSRGTMKVTDFGLARGDVANVTAVDLSHAGQFFGTPAYTAPEQAAELLGADWPKPSEASDQYALAAVLFEAVTGQLTHDPSGGRLSLLNRRMNEPVRPLMAADPRLGGGIEEVLQRALARDPAQRYGDLEAFAVALGEATTRSLGEGWLERSEVRIREPGPIADAATRGRPMARPAPPPPALAPPEPLPTPTGPVLSPTTGREEPGRARPRQVLIGSTVAVVILALAVVAAMVLRGADDVAGEPDAAATGPVAVSITERWSASTEGNVVGSAAVAGDLVVIGSEDGNLYALDASDGTRGWVFETGGPVRGSPAIGDGLVYVGSNDGVFYAVDLASGEARWEADLGYTIVSSPAVTDDIVVVGADQLYAFDAATGGAPIWTADVGGSIVSSPAVEDGTVVVGTLEGSVHAVSLDEGEARWALPTGDEVRSSPHVADAVVYVGSSDGRLYALDLATGRVRWEQDLGSAVKSSPTTSAGLVVVGTDGGDLVAIDAGDGTVAWRAGLGGRIDSSPLAVDDLVVVGSTDGRISVVAIDAGSVVGELRVGGPVISSPRRAGDVVVVGSFDDRIHALDGLVAA